jgi:hypothetical protein
MSYLSKEAGRYNASKFAFRATVVSPNFATGAGSIVVTAPDALADGLNLEPYALHTPLLVGNGSNQETVTPTAVAAGPGPYQYTVSASFSNLHFVNEQVGSGSAGLQEAVNLASQEGGGLVVIDNSYQGTSGMISGVYHPAGDNVALENVTAGTPAYTQLS